jgi:putative sterol carrier protein
MGDATAELFAELARSADEPALRKVSGTVRIELRDGKRMERWRVRFDRGKVKVSRKGGPADCVVRADKKLFKRVATGELNAFTATLRGELAVEGDFHLLLLAQRLFPAPTVAARKAS